MQAKGGTSCSGDGCENGNSPDIIAQMDNDLDRERGERLRALRLRRGWTQDQIPEQARRLGLHVSRASVGRYERGTPIAREQLKALATLYGVTMEEIDTGAPPATPTMGPGYARFREWLARQPYADDVDPRVFANLEALDPDFPEEMFRGVFFQLHAHYGT